MFRKALLTAAVMVMLASCGNGDENLAAPNTEVPVDVNITDPDFGLTIKATSLVRNVDPAPAGTEQRKENEELIAIKLDVTTGSDYDKRFYSTSLRIVTDVDGEEKVNVTISGPPTEATLNAAGRTPLGEVADASSGSGWIMAYVDPKAADSMTLRYGRPATQILLGGGSFPAQDFDAPLITAPAAK